MKEWYSAGELTGLPGLPSTDRRVRSTAERDTWKSRKRQRGKGLEYHLSSLPPIAQAALLKRGNGQTPFKSPSTAEKKPFSYDADGLAAHYERKPKAQKDKAKAALDLLLQVHAMVDAGHGMTDAMKLVAEANCASWRTLQNWWHGKPGKPGVKHYAREHWLYALVPGYTGRTSQAGCSPEAWEFFVEDYLRLERPAAAASYERLKRAAVANGWQVPALKTLERRLKAEIPLAVRTLRREGELAMQKLYPAQQRTVRDLYALQWINGDGYQHNVFVKWPDGSIARPKTWVWQDVFSRKILAWRTDLTEHTDVIRLSFGDLVETYGLPDHITIDNTRAAANKWMTGGTPWRNRYKVGHEDVLGLWPQLGIEVHWTSLTRNAGGKNVGHGQAKPIERAFGWGGLGEYVDKRLEFSGAWCGNNTADKPENYASSAVALDTFLAGLADSINAWNAREGRRTEACAGRLSFDMAFAASYQTALIRRPTADQRRLWLLPAEARRVQRDGSITLDAGSAPGAPRNRYWCEELAAHIGQMVVARFDPDSLHDPVEVYSIDGRYIAPAQCIQATGYGDTQAGREHTRARTQFKKAVRAQAKALTTIDTLQASRMLPGTDQADPPETKLSRLFVPAQRAAGTDAQVSQEEQDEMQANFARNVIRLAQSGD